MEKKFNNPHKDEFKDEVIDLRRVTKVTKGGRNLHFSATVAVGDGKGRIGIGSGKSNEVVEAIKKSATRMLVELSEDELKEICDFVDNNVVKMKLMALFLPLVNEGHGRYKNQGLVIARMLENLIQAIQGCYRFTGTGCHCK